MCAPSPAPAPAPPAAVQLIWRSILCSCYTLHLCEGQILGLTWCLADQRMFNVYTPCTFNVIAFNRPTQKHEVSANWTQLGLITCLSNPIGIYSIHFNLLVFRRPALPEGTLIYCMVSFVLLFECKDEPIWLFLTSEKNQSFLRRLINIMHGDNWTEYWPDIL